MAHKGLAGPYLFERDLTFVASGFIRYPIRWRMNKSGIFASFSLAGVPLVWVSGDGVADYSTGTITWTWPNVVSGGVTMAMQLVQEIVSTAPVSLWKCRASSNGVYGAFATEQALSPTGTTIPVTANASTLGTGQPAWEYDPAGISYGLWADA